MIKLYDVLKGTGLNSKDIRQRFNNKQIKINGRVVKNMNQELNIVDAIYDADEWLCAHDTELMKKISGLRYLFDSFGEMFQLQTNIDSEALRYMKSFLLLEVDKKTFYILMKAGEPKRWSCRIKIDNRVFKSGFRETNVEAIQAAVDKANEYLETLQS